MARPPGGTAHRFGARTKPSVSSTTNVRVIVDSRPRSSRAVSWSVHVPTAAADAADADAVEGPGKGTGYEPGCRSVGVSGIVWPPGPFSVPLTVEGRYTR
jgi:hypothetical protein